MSLCLLIPWLGGNPETLRKTLRSYDGICDQTLVVHQKLFDEDTEVAHQFADKVEVLDWNTVFQKGWGDLPNHHGQSSCNWMMLQGVGEHFAEQYRPMRETLDAASPRTVFYCDHVNDPNRWGRIWNPSSGVHWKAWIHEQASDSQDGGTIYRFQDTDKEKHKDEFVNECLRWYKTVGYHFAYLQLIERPEELGYCDRGWLAFSQGAKESILAFCEEHADLIAAGKSGDRQAFYNGVYRRMEADKPAVGVNFNRTGEKTSGNETVNMQCNEN